MSTEEGKASPPKATSKLNRFHLSLLLVTSTQNGLLWKVFASFAGFIDKQYHFSYTSLTTALSIATVTTYIVSLYRFSFIYTFTYTQLTTVVALFLNPQTTVIRTNLSIFLIQCLQIIGILILWLFAKYSIILFVIGLSLLLNVFQIHWGVTNMMVSAFIHNNDTKRQYLSIYNSNWTICTFLFIATGLIMHYYSYWFFLKIMLICSIFFAILNLIFLPKISIDEQNEVSSFLHIHSHMHSHPNIQMNSSQTCDASLSRSSSSISLRSDLKILFIGNRIYSVMFSALLLQFFQWGILYLHRDILDNFKNCTKL